MKMVDGMMITQVGEDWVAVPTGEASSKLHGIVRFNKTGKVVWDALAEGLDEEAAAGRLTDRYDVDDERALAAVRGVVEKLESAGLLSR
ncbi:MAG: PqqD family protein [Atopobiaceae bacterium]|nr:PqqD family protein [Atopobiaceae bacterium]